jgi:SAM-dependent MidA family methyltransferase
MTSPSLQQLIVERIQREGPITFADYMRMALYEPGYGYYVSGATRVGWEGDFYTSTDVGSFFANCMGRQLQKMWEQLGKPTPFSVLEQGAGHNDLAQGVRTWAEREAPEFYNALDYHTEDIKTGQDAISDTMENMLTPMVLLSNELVDAFPVHVVEVRQGRLYEVYVDVQDGHLCEVLDEPCSQGVAGYLDSYKIPWTTYGDGWRAEINLEARHWMQNGAQRIAGSSRSHRRKGFLLTIDYGDKARELYTKWRRKGTLACYFKHQLTERPLARPGEQDITAHVNFSALTDEGRRQGLHLQTFTTQRQWLTDTGIYDELARIRERDFALIDTDRASDKGQIALFEWYNLRQRVEALTDPAGMGNFKVLILKS